MLKTRGYSNRRFLVLTMKGLAFVEEWFSHSGRIPLQITKLYQLLLNCASMNGVVRFHRAQRMGYSSKVIERAVSNNYVTLTPNEITPEKTVIRRIQAMFDRTSIGMYI